MALLGAILLDPPLVLPQCIGKITPESFYDLRHQTIYETMLELYEDQAPVEVPALFERLQAWGKVEQVGGIAFIASLPDQTPSAANAAYYIDIVREKALMRGMVRVCTEAVSRIYDHEGECGELLDQVERDVLHVAESRVNHDTPSTLELVRTAITNIETYHQRNGELVGIGSGFIDLDRRTQGFRPGNMITLAARPSIGKTSLAMNIAEHAAIDNQIPTGVFSLEMTAEELVERMVSCRARVNLRNIREGFLAERDMPKLASAATRIGSAPLYIDDKAGQSILEVRAKARRWHQQYGIRFIIIDYLQLMNATGAKRKVESRQQEVSDISCGVKALAKELHVPVLVLSQLNRDVEREKNRRPRLSDLRESGSIEQDSDMVLFLYRQTRRNDDDNDDQEDDCLPTTLTIAKQRNGPTGEVHLTFLRCFTRFESAAKISDEDVHAPQHAPQQSLPYNDA